MQLEWSLRASRRLGRRTRFLARKNPRAARDANAAVLLASYGLADFPNVGRPYARQPDRLRELIVPFGSEGYALLYYVEDDRVVIASVKHQREASY